ncbi:MAG: methylated-DNA--[protein]-cysteine S-methyltransferase [Lactobacillales bacterium]|jgi:methylated-DNA-[protein]-cysteine S-methyltransferase|nr:methylated-DNA--[protein]-cysteine S-methyltransferase [Lactobacillales bacterium]
MYYSTHYPSPIGEITLACKDEKLVGLWMKGQKYHGDTIPEKMTQKDDCPVFMKTKKWLDRYFAGQKPSLSELPLAPIGGEFRQNVWDILCEIPYGTTLTYGDIAKKMAKKKGRKTMSAQAVGGAVGHNPISIIIPCHRVVGSNGSLTGFSAGIRTKIKLLELEGADLSNFFIPQKGTAL